MGQQETPRNQVEAPKHLSAWVDHFIGPQGAWPRLLDAQTHLSSVVKSVMRTPEYDAYSKAFTDFNLQLIEAMSMEDEEKADLLPTLMANKPVFSADAAKYKTRSHHPELSNEEVEQLLVYKFGLENEFVNGGTKIRMELREPSAVSVTSLGEIVESFDTSSQLGRDPLAKKLGFSSDVHQETKGEAFDRCGNEVEAWATHNISAISPEEKQAISEALQTYRNAYAQVKTSLEDAKKLVADAPSRGEGQGL